MSDLSIGAFCISSEMYAVSHETPCGTALGRVLSGACCGD